jgi:hypothetical protein
MRRSRDPWVRLQRQLSEDDRQDLQVAVSFGQLLRGGHPRSQIMFLLGLSEGDAHDLDRRIREMMRNARIPADSSSHIAEVLTMLAGPGETAR